jgi:hypothetical protein
LISILIESTIYCCKLSQYTLEFVASTPLMYEIVAVSLL